METKEKKNQEDERDPAQDRVDTESKFIAASPKDQWASGSSGSCRGFDVGHTPIWPNSSFHVRILVSSLALCF